MKLQRERREIDEKRMENGKWKGHCSRDKRPLKEQSDLRYTAPTKPPKPLIMVSQAIIQGIDRG